MLFSHAFSKFDLLLSFGWRSGLPLRSGLAFALKGRGFSRAAILYFSSRFSRRGYAISKSSHYYFRTIDLSVRFPIITALLARRNLFVSTYPLRGEHSGLR
jgi:hypothetical protein